ncbi:MAG: hypothetical protein ACR2GX_03645 [Candidatus Dormibacteria bacterium]
MGASARRVVEITEAIRPQRGALPRVVDVDHALAEVRSLPAEDDADTILLREAIGELIQWRNAAVGAPAKEGS